MESPTIMVSIRPFSSTISLDHLSAQNLISALIFQHHSYPKMTATDYEQLATSVWTMVLTMQGSRSCVIALTGAIRRILPINLVSFNMHNKWGTLLSHGRTVSNASSPSKDNFWSIYRLLLSCSRKQTMTTQVTTCMINLNWLLREKQNCNQLGPSSSLAINVAFISAAMGVPQGFQHKQEIEELSKRIEDDFNDWSNEERLKHEKLVAQMPKTSLLYWYYSYKELCKYEAQGYLMIRSLECTTSSCSYYTWTDHSERVRTGINYLGKARVIYNLLGMEEEAIGIDKSIANLRAHLINSDRDDSWPIQWKWCESHLCKEH